MAHYIDLDNLQYFLGKLSAVSKSGKYSDLSGTPSLAAYVTTNTTQTVTAAKTFSGKIDIQGSDSEYVIPLAVQCPGLSAGHGIFINLGRNGSLANRFSFGFNYRGNNSKENSFTISWFGASGGGGFAFKASGDAVFPGKLTIPTVAATSAITAPTMAAGDSSTNVATTAFVTTAVASATSGKADAATTLAGYGIADAYTKAEVDAKAYTLPAASTSTLGGIKVGARLSISGGVLSADIQTTDISGKADKATTLSGYGITDAYTKTEVDSAISSAESSAVSTVRKAVFDNSGAGTTIQADILPDTIDFGDLS